MTTTTLPKPRLERLYGEAPVTEADLQSQIRPKYRNVSCPDCAGLMTVVKVPVSKDGFTTVTYQCHNPGNTKSGMCLSIIQYTDSARVPMAPLNPTKADSVPYIRPGDLGSADIGWKAAAEQMIPAKDVKGLVKAKQVTPKKAFEGVKIKPQYPGERATLNKIIWDFFWSAYMAKGVVDKTKLEAYVIKVKGSSSKTDAALKTLPQWITERSGYAIKLSNGNYEVTGRTIGGKGIVGLPYSDPAYRKLHGFAV